MEPVRAPRMAEVGFALGDFVGVMGEGVVHAAAVQIQIFAAVLDADRGAFDMPAGVAQTPGALPLERLILKFALCEPQNKVVLVALVAVLGDVLAHAHLQLFFVHVAEDIVVVEL